MIPMPTGNALAAWFQRLEPFRPSGEIGIRIGMPDERLRLAQVAFGNGAVVGRIKAADRVEDAVLETLLGEFAEEAFHGVQPRG